MLDITMTPSTSELLASLATLPAAPSPDLSDKYMFIDTRRVIEDMRDLGFEVAGFRRPKHRTRSGAFALHEVDFRRPQDVDKGAGEAPRILFLNSYDGSRRAQLVSGIIRFICGNGLIAGDIMDNQKFLHLGDYEEQLLGHIKTSSENVGKVFDRIEEFRGITLDREAYRKMAEKGKALRYGEETKLDVKPETLLLARRREDAKADLWSTWNVLQENLLKGGIPGVDTSGNIRTTRPLAQIQKSNEVNQGLWDLLEEAAGQA